MKLTPIQEPEDIPYEFDTYPADPKTHLIPTTKSVEAVKRRKKAEQKEEEVEEKKKRESDSE